MVHIVVSLYGKVDARLITFVADNQIGPLFKTLLVLIKITISLKSFVAFFSFIFCCLLPSKSFNILRNFKNLLYTLF